MSKTAEERATARTEQARAVAEAYAADLVDPEKEKARLASLDAVRYFSGMRDELAAEHSTAIENVMDAVREAHALGVRTVDLVRVTGVSRQQISNYVAGTTSGRRGGQQ
jgi:hypothetical protein